MLIIVLALSFGLVGWSLFGKNEAANPPAVTPEQQSMPQFKPAITPGLD